MGRFSTRIDALSSFMSKELALTFLRHIKKRKISDNSVAQYLSSAFKILSTLKELGAFEMIQNSEDIANLPNLKELSLDQVYTHSADRSSW
jgi:hypothetical protein